MSRFSLVVLPLVLVACAAEQAPTTPEPDPEPSLAGCQPVSRQVLAAGERSPLGFGADEVLANLLGDGDGAASLALEYVDDVTTALDVRVTPAEIAFVDYEPVDDGSGREMMMICEDAVEVDADVEFVTADGAFAEVLAVRLSALGADQVQGWLTPDPLAGAFDAWAWVDSEAGHDEVTTSIAVSWTAGAPSGRVEVQGTGDDGEVAWATMDVVATFGGAEAP